MEFENQTALITGGGRGIGRAVAEALARGGAAVVLVGRGRESLETAVRELSRAGLRARSLIGDIADPELPPRIEKIAPQIDILINNAAVFATYGPLDEVPIEEIDRVLDVDLRAALLLIRHVLPGMKSRGYGRIVTIGSMAGTLGAAGQVAYSTAKSGLQGLTRSIAAECSRQGITCNLIEPGLITSERAVEKIDPETRENLVRATPLGRPGTVEEVAHVAAFLASEGAAFITGATLPVGGGLGLEVRPSRPGR